MNNMQGILQLAQDNNGTVTTAMVVAAGYRRGSLKHLVDIGKIELVSRGVYTLPGIIEDDFLNAQVKYKQGIFSLGSALFLLGLTDQTPHKLCMTFPANYNLTSPKKYGIQCKSSSRHLYGIGMEKIKTPSGNMVVSYGTERTLCDILKSANHVDVQQISAAFKAYVRGSERNIPLLSEYAKLLHVEARLRSYMEVLL